MKENISNFANFSPIAENKKVKQSEMNKIKG
jgi:hypothetical protein